MLLTLRLVLISELSMQGTCTVSALSDNDSLLAIDTMNTCADIGSEHAGFCCLRRVQCVSASRALTSMPSESWKAAH